MSAPFIALVTAVFYAAALVSARRGLRYSTPATVTCVSASVHTVTLWSAIFLTGGIPEVSPVAVSLFVLVGITQLGVRLFAYTGVHKIGASRSSTLQSISPLISAIIAISLL
ncbi:MAG: EamA family transporter, partial [Deltaproteobacteria bacterium]|nr:EamA family transporter [Deltaproteobacteria bacterium]